jgi:signal transduction histidine kinase/ActR/RegA family two-component response regulator
MDDESCPDERAVPLDFRIVTRDGTPRWINHACSPVYDREGKLLGRRVTNRDINQRKGLEEEVESLAKFPSENPNPVLRANGQGVILYANEAGYALMRTWGCAPGGELPHPVREVIPESFGRGAPGRVDVECGERTYAFEVVQPTGASYVNVYCTDVTERRKAEDTMRAARDALDREVRERTADLRRTNRLLRMISACNQALVGIEDEKELVQAICQLILDEGGFRMAWVGYAEQDDAKSVRSVASAGFEEGYLDHAQITWADTERGRGPTGRSIRECRACIGDDFLTQPELGPWRKDALLRGFRSSIALPLVSQGRAFGALTIYAEQPSAFDREQQKLLSELAGDLAFGIQSVRARAQRDQAQKSLEQRTILLRSLAVKLVQTEERERRRIGSVLHDQLQQLLAGARFGLESLRSTSGAESLQETVDKIDTMLRDCLDVSRSLTTELSPPIQYSAELENVLEWLSIWARERFGLQVLVEIAEKLRLESEEIRMTLFRAVRELLFNIVKHAGVKEAHVSVSLLENSHVQVVVRDNGKGFDVAAIQGRGGTSGGFGLFSLQERLEALGGSIYIDSVPGRGSCFTLRVPVHVERPESQPPWPASRSRGGRGRKGQRSEVASHCGPKIRVLLVDDHLVVRQGLAMVLGGEPDIEIIGEASDGPSAIDLARKLLPDVVTMDVGLPGMSGIEATRAIHAELPDIAIIGLSMFEDRGDAMREAGAVAYLAKEGASSSLLEAIRSSCHKAVT